MEASAFLLRHDAVGFSFILHGVHALLLLVEPLDFSLIELAVRDSLINALFLVGLTMIDARRFPFGIGHPSHKNDGPDSQHNMCHGLLLVNKTSLCYSSTVAHFYQGSVGSSSRRPDRHHAESSGCHHSSSHRQRRSYLDRSLPFFFQGWRDDEIAVKLRITSY